MSASLAPIDRVLDSVGSTMTLDFARRITMLRPDPTVELWLEKLAEKSTAGTLTDSERSEYESLVILGDLIANLQKRARKLLAQAPNGD